MADLDIAQLATLLHKTPDQVTRMAVRGQVPGRKVAGHWRFSQAELHHWIEDKIGASDPEELDRYQQVLDRVSDGSADRKLSELCGIDTIQVPLNSRTRGSVIRSMCSLATTTGLMWDAAAMAEAVKAREQLHPTALDCGVALLHPRRPQTSILADSVLALGICPSPIPFSDSGHLTDIFFLICSYDDRSHLRILAKLSRLVADEEFLDKLRRSESSGDAWYAIETAEASLG